MSKDKYVITQVINRKPVSMPVKQLKEDGAFLNIQETMISQIIEAKNNKEFEFVCSQIQNFIEENNIGVCFAINKSELIDCLQEHQKLKLTIANLEAKLAECEKSNEYFADRVEKADKEIKENYRNYNKLVEEYNEIVRSNQDLEKQLAESEEKVKLLENDRVVICNTMDMYIEKVKNLKQQLAEKDKELLEIKQRIAEKASKEFQEMIYKRENHNQDKISFAVEQLEKVKEKLLEELQNVTDLLDPLEYEDYHEFIGCGRGYKNSIEELDNQIEQLKKGDEVV